MKSNQATTTVVVCTVFPIFALLAVCLRVYSQKLKGNNVHADEYIIFSGLVVVYVLCGLMVYGAADGGVGWHIQDLQGRAGRAYIKIIFFGLLLWAASITLVRISLLVFYRRIFTLKPFQIANNVLIGVNIAWFTSLFFGAIFSSSLETIVQARINYPAWLLVNGTLDMVLDIMTLCMPLFVIRTLQIGVKKKFTLAGIFSLGFFCIVASAVRLGYYIQLIKMRQADRHFSTITFNCVLWSVIEPCASIIAACLPTYGPLFEEGHGLTTIFRSIASKVPLTSNKSHISLFSAHEDQLQKMYRNKTQSSSKERLKNNTVGNEFEIPVA
ncbi:hypothetical protein EPUS_07328 [Endocarpon pusillum Z07020]|uniref:Rhodopsin domain-containing protein n=1 Tax=Endocarpon pusillum (strain Z07020 / HMAS-L-300199) TaxID=1263415 RepID=U1GVE4_ENDPU|nr:uncharacterized protein EPUS_07328 [Endocarpon pusillum Z07020]ERF76448.1 hypothetical protein EPUS_07328 [Endocarpon pusillum Z07020]